MFPSQDDVERRARELRRQREQIEAELADLDQFLDLGRRLSWLTGWASERGAEETQEIGGPTAEAVSESTPERDRTTARRQGHLLMNAVVEILGRAGRPLHVSEIHRALEERGLALGGASPIAALNTRLWKRAQAGRLVSQAGPEATYRLADEQGSIG